MENAVVKRFLMVINSSSGFDSKNSPLKPCQSQVSQIT